MHRVACRGARMRLAGARWMQLASAGRARMNAALPKWRWDFGSAARRTDGVWVHGGPPHILSFC
eukprot:7157495-Prymnesium_polylepis.1